MSMAFVALLLLTTNRALDETEEDENEDNTINDFMLLEQSCLGSTLEMEAFTR